MRGSIKDKRGAVLGFQTTLIALDNNGIKYPGRLWSRDWTYCRPYLGPLETFDHPLTLTMAQGVSASTVYEIHPPRLQGNIRSLLYIFREIYSPVFVSLGPLLPERRRRGFL